MRVRRSGNLLTGCPLLRSSVTRRVAKCPLTPTHDLLGDHHTRAMGTPCLLTNQGTFDHPVHWLHHKVGSSRSPPNRPLHRKPKLNLVTVDEHHNPGVSHSLTCHVMPRLSASPPHALSALTPDYW